MDGVWALVSRTGEPATLLAQETRAGQGSPGTQAARSSAPGEGAGPVGEARLVFQPGAVVELDISSPEGPGFEARGAWAGLRWRDHLGRGPSDQDKMLQREKPSSSVALRGRGADKGISALSPFLQAASAVETLPWGPGRGGGDPQSPTGGESSLGPGAGHPPIPCGRGCVSACGGKPGPRRDWVRSPVTPGQEEMAEHLLFTSFQGGPPTPISSTWSYPTSRFLIPATPRRAGTRSTHAA